MCMAIFWIVHIWVDTSLKDLLVKAWLGGGLASSPGEMDVEKGWDMSQIDQTAGPELDGLRK